LRKKRKIELLQKFLWPGEGPDYILYYEGGEALEQIAQRSCGCASLEVFKARLDGAVSYLVWWTVSLPVAGGLELGDL